MKLKVWRVNGLGLGPIPTYMGTTRPPGIGQRLSEAYPHIHGHYNIGSAKVSFNQGSFPHIWGLLFWFSVRVLDFGFISIYIGTTRAD